MENETLKELLTRNYYLLYLTEILALALVVWNLNKKRALVTLAIVTTSIGVFSFCAMKYNWFPASLLVWQFNAVLFSTIVSAFPSRWKFRHRILLWVVVMWLHVGAAGIIQLFLIWVWLPLFLLIRFVRAHGENTRPLFAALSMLGLYFILMLGMFWIFAGLDFLRTLLWNTEPSWLKTVETILVGKHASPDSAVIHPKALTLFWNLMASAIGAHYAIKGTRVFLKEYDTKKACTIFSVSLIFVYATLTGFIMIPAINSFGIGVYDLIDILRPILTPAVAIGVAYFHNSIDG